MPAAVRVSLREECKALPKYRKGSSSTGPSLTKVRWCSLEKLTGLCLRYCCWYVKVEFSKPGRRLGSFGLFLLARLPPSVSHWQRCNTALGRLLKSSQIHLKGGQNINKLITTLPSISVQINRLHTVMTIISLINMTKRMTNSVLKDRYAI